jgi:hypothetical protein
MMRHQTSRQEDGYSREVMRRVIAKRSNDVGVGTRQSRTGRQVQAACSEPQVGVIHAPCCSREQPNISDPDSITNVTISSFSPSSSQMIEGLIMANTARVATYSKPPSRLYEASHERKF